MAIALNRSKNDFTNNPFFKAVSSVAGNIITKTQEVTSNVVNETKKIAGNIARGTKQVAGNVAKSTVKIAKNISNETKKIRNNVVNETKRIVGNVKRETKRVADNVAKGTKQVAGNISKSTVKVISNISNETKRVIRNVNKETKRIAGNIVRGTKKVASNVAKGNFAVLNGVVKDIAKETRKIIKGVAKESYRIATNVARGTSRIISGVSKEAGKIVKNIAGETSRIVRNVTNETKRITGNIIKGTAGVAKNIIKSTAKIANDVNKETIKIVKDVAKEVNRIKNNVVNEAKNILYAASKFPIIGSNARDLHALLQEAEIEQINKELDAQEEEQDKKTFYDKISNMELDESTVSNRIGAIDGSDDKSIYNNFKESKLKVGMEITIGKKDRAENFKILEIMDKTKSGIRGIAVGNMKTGKVEIILEGSMPPNEFFKNPTKVTKHWANNISGNMRRSSLGLLKGATSLNLPNFSDVYRSNENGTPLDYQEALEFSKKIQNEYKNGKDGFKGLVRVSGHSKAGGASIYIASHLNIEAIAVDPAPVNNPGRYLYNNKILKVIPDNEGDFINGALLNEVKTNSKGEKISSSRTFGLQKAVENINIKDPIGKLKNFQQFIKGPKTDNLATMVVKVKEGSLWHKTDIGDVIEKEKTLLNEIKLYKSNKNRGR